MKRCNLLLYLCLVVLSGSILNCQNHGSTQEDQSMEGNQLFAEPDVEISGDEAEKRVDQYLKIYGETGMRHLEGNNDSVLLPRYFVINSDSFYNLIQGIQTDEQKLYASLNVKERADNASSKDTAVSDLIFHLIQPHPDGSLNEPEKDQFFDYGNACPIDCGDSYAHGGYNTQPVTTEDAINRIARYNTIYGTGKEQIRYIKSASSTDSVLIPRYYTFNHKDIKDLLAVMKTKKHEFFYVSIGAEPVSGKTNTYFSDLIFHYVRPSPQGYLKVGHQSAESLDLVTEASDTSDTYEDVTTPCPPECDQ